MAAVHAECCSIGDEEKLLRNRCVRVRVVYTGKGRGITGVFYPPGQNMNKEEGNGYPRFFSSPHYYWNSRIYLEFSRERGGKGRTLCLHDSRFLPIFNIFENFLAPFIFSYIRYSSHLYRSTIAFPPIFKKDYVSSIFFFFFFCLYIIWSIFVIILREFSSIEKEN